MKSSWERITNSLTDLLRIDIGLEGNWAETVTTVWTREGGFRGFASAARQHRTYRPSIELVFSEGWIGLRCDRQAGSLYVLDEQVAREIIDRATDGDA
jgi:hypothetical protein